MPAQRRVEPPVVALDELIFGLRRCPVCGRSLPASSEYFARDCGEAGGLTHSCRSCRRARERRRDRRVRHA